VAIEGFCDFALVDSLATSPQPSSRWYSDLHDAGVGILSRQQIGELAWTLRLEFPVEMNARHLGPDFQPPGTRVALRWLVGLRPTF